MRWLSFRSEAARAVTLTVRNLTIARGGLPVLSGLSFLLEPGQAMILRGPNGAGKTTLLRTLAGLQPPLAGEVSGADDTIAYAGHADGLKAMLSVSENLRFWADVFGQQGLDAALDAYCLRELEHRFAGTLSAGQKRRLGLSRLLVTGRPIWMLDEPTVSLDKDAVGAGRLEALAGPVLRSVLSGETKRFLLGVRLPAVVARLFHPRARKLMGVNFSLPRAAFLAVDGYDETWDVPWREDRDLELRLLRAEVPFYPLLNRAVVYHLWHETKPFGPESQAINDTIEARTIVRCAQSLGNSA